MAVLLCVLLGRFENNLRHSKNGDQHEELPLQQGYPSGLDTSDGDCLADQEDKARVLLPNEHKAHKALLTAERHSVVEYVTRSLNLPWPDAPPVARP